MKKKIVFFAVLLVMVFAMAVSVGATNYEPEFGEVTSLDGIAEPTTLDKESRVLMTDGVTYPAYYILNDSTSFSPNFNKINNIVGANKYSRGTVKALEIPEGITNLPSCWNAGGFFQGDKYTPTIEYVRLPSTLDTIGEAAIYEIKTLKVIDNFENTKVETIPARLRGLTSLQYIHFPNTVKTISQGAFFNCTSVEYIIFGSSIESISTQAFYKAGTTSGKSSLKVYMSSTLNAIINSYGDGILQECNSVVELYYTGTIDDAGMQQMLASPGIKKNASSWKKVDASAEGFDINATYTESTIIYNYSACEAFYNGKHEEDNNPCVIYCSQCGANGIAEKNPIHDMQATVSYSLGFDVNGSKITKCTNEGCKHSIEEEAVALFTCLGYSIPDDGREGIVISFTLNQGAIDEYTSITGNTFRFGAFAAAESKIGTQDVVSADGQVAENTISADITDYGISAFDLVVLGFAEEYRDLGMAMGAYVIDGDAVSYMQAGEPNENEKYYFASYNEVLDLVSSK